MNRQIVLEMCDGAKDFLSKGSECAAMMLMIDAIRELASELTDANLLKDLKALTQSDQRVIREREELKSLVYEQWDEGSKVYQELMNMWEKSGVKGFHSLIEWVEWLVKERDDLAVRLAQARMDLDHEAKEKTNK